MTSAELVRFIASFLGGGFVVGIGNWIYSSWSARRAREVESLREQLRLLYGPLFFFTSQNEKLFKLSDNVGDAYREFFEGKEWSDDPNTQEALTKQADATIDLRNTYVQRVIENNARVMEILENNWHLADAADLEALSAFQVDYTRFLVEVKKKGRKDVPFSVVIKLGHISFMRSDVVDRVRATFQKKRTRLGKLVGVSGDE